MKSKKANKTNMVVRFFGRIYSLQNCFRFYLTFSIVNLDSFMLSNLAMIFIQSHCILLMTFMFNLQNFSKHRGQHWRWGLCMMKTRSYNRRNLSIEKCQQFSSHYICCKCTLYSGPSFVGLQLCKVCLLLSCKRQRLGKE